MPIAIKRKKAFFLLAVNLWAALLVFLALLPEKTVLFALRKPPFFAVAHVTAYIVLAFLLSLYFKFQRVFLSFRMHNALIIGFTLIFSLLCGGVTEAVQVARRMWKP